MPEEMINQEAGPLVQVRVSRQLKQHDANGIQILVNPGGSEDVNIRPLRWRMEPGNAPSLLGERLIDLARQAPVDEDRLLGSWPQKHMPGLKILMNQPFTVDDRQRVKDHQRRLKRALDISEGLMTSVQPVVIPVDKIPERAALLI